MKRLHFHSFRQRLNAAFLAVSLAPLLLCSALLLQIFRFRMTADQQQNAQQQLSSACHALNTMQDGILSAAESLQRDGLVTRALAGAQEDSAKVYSSLYTATAAVRSTARFDLYSADGTLLYSTQAAPGEDALSPDWGILYEAAQAENGTLVYSASEDPTDPDAPVLRAAARLTVSGKTAGFLVAVMYEQQLRAALDEMFRHSSVLLAQEFIPTEFDWRIGLLDGEPLFACKYYMAKGHWQIYNHAHDDTGRNLCGAWETVPIYKAPQKVLDTAVKAAALIGKGLYGVDLKLINGRAVVIEINDNPSIDHEVEDAVLGDELYYRILNHFVHCLNRLHAQ